jgi:DNA-binding IscR family transcriptional regulator
MKRDGRLSGVLHVLLHMTEYREPVTSEFLAEVMGTNPVVVRRILSGLRERGYVRSGKGHGGGWTLDCDFETTTLRDIYVALGRPSLLAMGLRDEASSCLVEQAVNAALAQTFAQAEQLVLERLGEVTLAALSANFRSRLSRRSPSARKAHPHGS